MEYNYDEESVNALINRAETAQLPQEVTLSEAEHIFDTSLYVNANICDIKQHYPDAFYIPNPGRPDCQRNRPLQNRRCACSPRGSISYL